MHGDEDGDDTEEDTFSGGWNGIVLWDNDGVRVHFLMCGFLFFLSLSTPLLLLMPVPDIIGWIGDTGLLISPFFIHK